MIGDIESGGTRRALGSIDEIFVSDGLQRFRLAEKRAVVEHGSTLVLRGWAASADTIRPARRLALEVDGSEVGIVRSKRLRPDVADHFNEPAMVATGFLASIDTNDLAPGLHRLRIVLDDGSHLPELDFEISATARRKSGSQARQLEIEIVSFHGQLDEPAALFRVELGLPAVVRGVIDTDRAIPLVELYAQIDGFDAFPARLDRGPERMPFLLCFRTDDLELGRHTLQFIARSRDRRTLHVSDVVTFTIVPLCVNIGDPRLDSRTAPASIDWAERDIAIAKTSAPQRTFERGEIACVRGWAIDPVARDSAASVYVRFENGQSFRMEARGARPDVAGALGIPSATFCGFTGSISVAALAPGKAIGRVYIVSKSGNAAYATEATVALDVRDSSDA